METPTRQERQRDQRRLRHRQQPKGVRIRGPRVEHRRQRRPLRYKRSTNWSTQSDVRLRRFFTTCRDQEYRRRIPVEVLLRLRRTNLSSNLRKKLRNFDFLLRQRGSGLNFPNIL